MNAVVASPREDTRSQRVDQVVPVGGHAGDERALKGGDKLLARLLAISAEGDDLGEQGIVVRRNDRAARGARIDADALAAGRHARMRPVEGAKSA